MEPSTVLSCVTPKVLDADSSHFRRALCFLRQCRLGPGPSYVHDFRWQYFLDVFFEPTANRATASARERLPEMVSRAESLKLHPCCPDVLWTLEAHVDRGELRPSAHENLAQDRAEYVQGLLVGLGVSKNRRCKKSFGASSPALKPPNAKNARVEIYALCARNSQEANGSWC